MKMHLVALTAAKKYKDRGHVKFLEILLCSKENLSLYFRSRSDFIKCSIQEAKNDACFFLLSGLQILPLWLLPS